LNQPFEIQEKNYNYIRKLFADSLFWVTFENMDLEGQSMRKANSVAENDNKSYPFKG
jgi:hypothetical protein